MTYWSKRAAERRHRAIVRDRDQWTCLGCGKTPRQAERVGLRLEVHTRLQRIHGGRETPDNGVTLCGFGPDRGCRRLAYRHRLWAVMLGLSLDKGADPAEVPVQDSAGVRWQLNPNGTRRRITREAA
jgi:hypothetical protein